MTTTKNRVQNNIFVLKEKIKEVENVVTLKFLPVKSEVFPFQAGQFIMVYFLSNNLCGIGKPYSISSSPKDKFLTITVKKVGVFSSALHKLKKGEQVKIIGPYGNFCSDKSMKSLVFLAGGIGIAPLFSIIKNFYLKKSPRKIFLFYSNRTKKEIVFFRELNKIASKWPKFKPIYFLTREKTRKKTFGEYRRINVKILKKYLKSLKGNYYFVCGPKEFVFDLCQKLKNGGVNEKFIKTEAFY